MVEVPPEVVDGLRRHGAVFAFVHGSVAAGTARPDSDVDIAAWFGGANPPPWEVGVDLPDVVDLLVLDSAPLELAGRVAQHGVSAAHHVCASEGWGPPSTNADAVRVLGPHGVLGPELAESVAQAAGFRNLLVHGDAAIDDDLVVEHLGRLSDLRASVEARTELLA